MADDDLVVVGLAVSLRGGLRSDEETKDLSPGIRIPPNSSSEAIVVPVLVFERLGLPPPNAGVGVGVGETETSELEPRLGTGPIRRIASSETSLKDQLEPPNTSSREDHLCQLDKTTGNSISKCAPVPISALTRSKYVTSIHLAEFKLVVE